MNKTEVVCVFPKARYPTPPTDPRFACRVQLKHRLAGFSDQWFDSLVMGDIVEKGLWWEIRLWQTETLK